MSWYSPAPKRNILAMSKMQSCWHTGARKTIPYKQGRKSLYISPMVSYSLSDSYYNAEFPSAWQVSRLWNQGFWSCRMRSNWSKWVQGTSTINLVLFRIVIWHICCKIGAKKKLSEIKPPLSWLSVGWLVFWVQTTAINVAMGTAGYVLISIPVIRNR